MILYISPKEKERALECLDEAGIQYEDATMGHIDLVEDVNYALEYMEIDYSFLSKKKLVELYEYAVDGILNLDLSYYNQSIVNDITECYQEEGLDEFLDY